MNALICGVGRMGSVIAYAMNQLGYNIEIVETNPDCIEKLKSIPFVAHSKISDVTNTPDIVVSSLPYYLNFVVAKTCAKNQWRYCDLGGSVPNSEEILGLERKIPFITDLGLAPGWVNIIAEECYHMLGGADSITMMTGGIPAQPGNNPLNYSCTWSVDGLLNEYFDHCVILENNEIKYVPGMSGLQKISILDKDLEAFYTSGASSHSIPTMKNRNVKNCSYKTLRYPGHCELVSWLYKALGATVLRQIFNHCMPTEDIIVLHVEAKWHEDSNFITKIIHAETNFTAMQRATAFPISAAAHQLAQGKLDHLITPTYQDIDFSQFNQTLECLGI